MKAIVNTSVLPMFGAPIWQSTVEDEVLYGMVVDVVDEPAPGWCYIRTHYRYEGIVHADRLILDQEAVAKWEALPKMVVRNKNFCDVLSEPRVQGWTLESLPRGCVVSPIGQPEKGWQRVRLADGRVGYVMASILDTYYSAPCSEDEDTLRRCLCDSAQLYNGTHYRWGGKTPQGIDCSGLCSMAYMLCGILIYRDAKIMPGFPMREIKLADIKPGDLLFFPGHVAMYLGDGRYCHSTGRAGDDGFTYNSLNPEDPDYREDLKNQITQVGSIF